MKRIAKKIIAYEWLILLLILPPLLFPNGLQGLLLLVIPALWLVRWLSQRHFIPPTPYDSAILLLLLMVGVSMIAVFDVTLSFPKIVGVILGIGLFYGAVTVQRRYAMGGWYVIAFFVLASSAMVAIGLIGVDWPEPFHTLKQIRTLLPAALQQIPGTIDGRINANELAGLFSWIVPLLIILLAGLWRTWSWPLRILLLLIVGIFGVLLLATLSRGGIVACGLSLLLVFAIANKWGRWLLLVAIAATIALFLVYDLEMILSSGQGGDDLLSLNSRLEIWSRALYGIADFPFTGMSMNGFRRVVHILYPLFLVAPDVDLGHAHNHLLQVALDLGIPGLIAYLGLWFISFVLLWQSWRQATHQSTRIFALALMGALLGGWLFGILDAIALGARPSFMWWLLLAMSVGVYDAMRHQRDFLLDFS